MISRTSLGWSATRAPAANTNKGMVVHYDGKNQGLARKSCTACRDYWRRTREFHTNGHGWIDIGYAYGVCPHGNIYEGRGYGRVQAAAKQSPGKLPNGNDRWVNVTFMSGPNEMPTPDQIEAFRSLRSELMSRGMAGEVKGHRDFTSTRCPGEILYGMVKNGTFKASGKSKEKDVMKPSDIWNHEIPVPWGTKENPEWQADSLLVNANQRIRALEESVKELHEKIDALIRIAS